MFDVLGFFWNLLQNLIKPIIDFLLSFLPNGDPAIYEVIDRITSVGGLQTFNVFYFCDWFAVLACFGVLVTITIIVQVTKLVLKGLKIADKAVEIIPIYE